MAAAIAATFLVLFVLAAVRRSPLLVGLAGGLSLLAWVAGIGMGLLWAPPDRYMGEVQRVMYVHVPIVWVCLIALAVNFAGSVWWLISAQRWADSLAEAVAEAGVWFGLLGLLTGAIWGRATWGVWWSWDPRMISVTVMLIFYSGYLVLRLAFQDQSWVRFGSAACAVSVSAVLPVVWFSVKWWASLHQLQSDATTMDPVMRTVLLWNLAALFGVFGSLVGVRLLRVAPLVPDEPAKRTDGALAAP